MSDLLSSLLVRASSHESFHSATSQPAPPQPAPGSALPLHDVASFLSAASTASLLGQAGPAPQATTTTNSSTSSPPAPATPSPASVSRLYELCQEKGLTPLFSMTEDAPQRFRGTLTLGPITLSLPSSHPSKKEARQHLAEQGCALARTLPAAIARAPPPPPSSSSAPAENWVGKLLEHSAAHPSQPAPTFTESAVAGGGFVCECRIAQRPGEPFGGVAAAAGGEGPFASKKAARAYAAREAVRFLVEREGVDGEGGAGKGKKRKGGLGVGRNEVGVGDGEEEEEDGDGDGERSWVGKVLGA
ncbi:hypothetical protein MMC26_006603 [Xylographa opegraphella]|nr:hypothetical protein [Xylographa opegraphella]